MNCKDCYCFDVCSKATVRSDNEDTRKENECKYFRDKDRMVELPCRVGDTVNFMTERYTKCSVHNDSADNCYYGCYEVCEKGFVCDSKKKREMIEVLVDGFEINSIGTKICLHNGYNLYLPDDRVFLNKED